MLVETEVSSQSTEAPPATVWTRIFKRPVDFMMAALLLILLALPMLVIAVLVRVTSRGPVLYRSDRIGRHNRVFRMPKFRSMRVEAPEMATHLFPDPEEYLTPIGRVLRKTSLDELPQLFSILCGDISFVGPRPALFNQDDLISLRTERGIHRLTPGLTGWAQINGRDELPLPQKVEFDHYYLRHQSFGLDMKILLLTLITVLRADGVSH